MSMLNSLQIYFKKILVVMGVLTLIAIPSLVASVPALADTPQAVCDGIAMAGGDCSGDSASNSIESLITNIINIFSWVVGIVAVIMIIFAGFTYITSAGGDGVKTAKNILIYAVIGLIIVVFAQVIVRFAIGTASKSVGIHTSLYQS